MKVWIRFALYNALIGLLIGIYLATNATGEGYSLFGLAAPLAAFIAAALFWKWLIGETRPIGTGRVVITGLLTGTVSHYIAFMLLSIAMNICYWTTGGCTGSLGDPPAGIMSMFTGALAYSFFSLMIFGWITAPASVLIGFWVRWRANTEQL